MRLSQWSFDLLRNQLCFVCGHFGIHLFFSRKQRKNDVAWGKMDHLAEKGNNIFIYLWSCFFLCNEHAHILSYMTQYILQTSMYTYASSCWPLWWTHHLHTPCPRQNCHTYKCVCKCMWVYACVCGVCAHAFACVCVYACVRECNVCVHVLSVICCVVWWIRLCVCVWLTCFCVRKRVFTHSPKSVLDSTQIPPFCLQIRVCEKWVWDIILWECCKGTHAMCA